MSETETMEQRQHKAIQHLLALSPLHSFGGCPSCVDAGEVMREYDERPATPASPLTLEKWVRIYEDSGEPPPAATLIAKAREMDAALAEARKDTERLAAAQRLVDAQAEDAGLWFIARTAPEGYLQQELRKLHAAIEAKEDA